MLWETSLLDPEEGIRFRGLSIPELQVRTGEAEAEEEARGMRQAVAGQPGRRTRVVAAGEVQVIASVQASPCCH